MNRYMNWLFNFRKTDPDTSVQAAYNAPRKKIRERILEVFMRQGLARGYTGHELADVLGVKLNSVTPRFAELSRLGLIKDSTQRRDGQIVWVLKEEHEST